MNSSEGISFLHSDCHSIPVYVIVPTCKNKPNLYDSFDDEVRAERYFGPVESRPRG